MMREVLTLEDLRKAREAFDSANVPTYGRIISAEEWWIDEVCEAYGVDKSKFKYLGDNLWEVVL